ncbi:hypothetical protein BDB00DRAFT_878268 [Zychaea mexicana]|uniref:uncharacterized protein n=1 Tax=Zychaea mexicana TaxID=64656 RepID=UPI0022FDEA2D|nr:uncharacterized protein BDB00DRAFT_878268 [Zychaea mexicana]KAI9484938.1 hypothetical protein BDB00DRAFT_878268 [Zychaea mexicana]
MSGSDNHPIRSVSVSVDHDPYPHFRIRIQIGLPDKTTETFDIPSISEGQHEVFGFDTFTINNTDGREAAGLWVRFANIWNTKHANGSTIFYKLPPFLQVYHTTWKHAQDTRKTISRAKETLKQVDYAEQRHDQAVSAPEARELPTLNAQHYDHQHNQVISSSRVSQQSRQRRLQPGAAP